MGKKIINMAYRLVLNLKCEILSFVIPVLRTFMSLDRFAIKAAGRAAAGRRGCWRGRLCG